MTLKALFAEWTKGLVVDASQAAIDHTLTVKFLNTQGVEKTIRMAPSMVALNVFGATLTEDGFYVGDFELTLSGKDSEEILGEYVLNVIPNNEEARIHYEKNAFPIMNDKDFTNFVEGFHLALKAWKEAQSAQKES